MKMPITLVGASLALITIASVSATPNATLADFQARGVNHNNTGNNLPYRVFVPDGYNLPENATRQYPIVLFMHGLGERGTDNSVQVTGAGGPVLGLVTGANRDAFPAFVVCPQIPTGQYSDWGLHAASTHSIVELLRGEFRIDASRIYATGLSLGAIGTWAQIRNYPGYYAAGIPASYNPHESSDTNAAIAAYAQTPLWVFYGESDSYRGAPGYNNPGPIVQKVRDAGGYVIYTDYPSPAGHDSGTWGTPGNGKGLCTAGLMQWLCSQQLGTVSTEAPSAAYVSPTSALTYGTSSASLNISGTATDAMGGGAARTITSVGWVNDRGGSGTATGTTGWSASSIALQTGTNKLQLIVTDDQATTFNRLLTVTRSGDTVAPTVAITNPVTGGTYSTSSGSINLGGTASDNVGVTTVTWLNNRGGSGTAAGTSSWSVSGISLASGANVLTITAVDAANNTASAILTVTYTAPPVNQAPIVNAGSDQSLTLPAAVSLTGTVSDDGLAPGNATPTVSWSKLSGTGTVAFANANMISTTATFSVAGTYVLRLAASDGVLSSSDDLTVIVSDAPSLSDWTSQDIGSVALTGSTTSTDNTATVVGSGNSFGIGADQIQFAYQAAVNGDCSIVARITSLTGGHQWYAKGGIMIRESLAPASRFAFMGLTRGFGTTNMFHTQPGDGWSTSYNGNSSEVTPYWVKLTRVGNVFTGYKSINGSTWVATGSATMTMGSTVYIGMATCAMSTTATAATSFDNITTTGIINWSSSDIGSVGLPGTASESAGVFTVLGSGDSFTGNTDQFQYVYRDASGDCSIIAKVSGLTGGHIWNARAGVMIREVLAPASRHVYMGITRGYGTNFVTHWSAGDSWSSGQWGTSSEVAPYWVKITRVGNVFTGYKSPDGTNWTLVGTSTVSMGATCYIGLLTSSAANTQLSTATFTDVVATP